MSQCRLNHIRIFHYLCHIKSNILGMLHQDICRSILNCFKWHTCTILNTCIFRWIPKIILPILTGGSLVPFIASKMIFKSHSKTASQMPTSHAKVTPSSKSLRFCLKRSHWLVEILTIAASTLLSLTRITA